MVADAVKVVRDTAGASNTVHSFTYSYDPTGNQTGIADTSAPAPAITSYVMGYDPLNRLTLVQEKNTPGGSALHSTGYTYDAASNLKTRTHDGASSAFDCSPPLRMSMTATLRVGARGDGEPRPAGCRAGWWWTRWRRGGQSVAAASSLMAVRAEASSTMVLPAV